MAKEILFIVTSHSELGNTGTKTGWYLPEVAHPYQVLTKKGYYFTKLLKPNLGFVITVASPKGGMTPQDPGSLEAFKEDKHCIEFLADKVAIEKFNNSINIADIDSKKFSAVVFPGGHGPMFDLRENEIVQRVTREIAERNGVVGAVCHGPAGMVNVKLSNGAYLLQGKKVTGFSDVEEELVGLTKVVPFSLEQELVRSGGQYSKAGAAWGEFVVVDGRLVTGQNPASSLALADAVALLLK